MNLNRKKKINKYHDDHELLISIVCNSKRVSGELNGGEGWGGRGEG